MKISLREISQIAGVTPSTASRIINDRDGYHFTEETVQKVKSIAQEYGYRPNQLYQSVFSGRTLSVGVILSNDPFYIDIINGVYDHLLDAGYATLLGINNNDYDTPDNSTEKKVINRLLKHRVDGFILRPTLDNAGNEHFKEIISNKLPLVVVDRKVNSSYADFVCSDDINGGRLAASYLLSLGHKNIGQFIGNTQCSTFRDRALGFEQEILESGLCAQSYLLETHFMDSVAKKAKLVFSGPNHPTAVFCCNDLVVGIIYDTLLELGLKVPSDVSIIGYGNLPISQHLRPKLTTIEQNPRRIGEKAAELLLNRLNNNKTMSSNRVEELIPVSLLTRDSCAEPLRA